MKNMVFWRILKPKGGKAAGVGDNCVISVMRLVANVARMGQIVMPAF
jgi:hypothetical protein